MKKRNFSFLLAAIILPSFTFGLSGCAQLNKDLAWVFCFNVTSDSGIVTSDSD